jgi:hypothetical protein
MLSASSSTSCTSTRSTRNRSLVTLRTFYAFGARNSFIPSTISSINSDRQRRQSSTDDRFAGRIGRLDEYSSTMTDRVCSMIENCNNNYNYFLAAASVDWHHRLLITIRQNHQFEATAAVGPVDQYLQ